MSDPAAAPAPELPAASDAGQAELAKSLEQTTISEGSPSPAETSSSSSSSSAAPAAAPEVYKPKSWVDEDEFTEEERKALLAKAEDGLSEGLATLGGELFEQDEDDDPSPPPASSASSSETPVPLSHSAASSSSSSDAPPAASSDGNPAPVSFLRMKVAAPIDTKSSFETIFKGRPDLLNTITELNFKHPSKIQAATIPLIMKGESFKAESPSGTGKTGAFGLGSIACVDVSINSPQVIIVSPSRELTLQTHFNIERFAKNVPGLKIKLCVSEHDKTKPATKAPKKKIEGPMKAHILVATPGTLVHKKWDSSHAKILVLDEADHLLEIVDNIKDIIKIRQKMKPDAQVLAYSATYSDAIKEAFKQVCPSKHKYVFWRRESSAVVQIKDYKIICNDENVKYELLKEILDNSATIGQSICFCQTKAACHSLILKLQTDRYDAREITSDSSHEERDGNIMSFIRKELNTLVGTNVLARGIDVEAVSLVVNFDIPATRDVRGRIVPDKTTYIHRIGRTGRWDRTGVAFNLVTPTDLKLLNQIEKDLRRQIEEIPFDQVLDKIEAILSL